ncbi:hypothetical protein H6P81_018912 [Aristolochia fimbriata]|uniref:C2H2-type domain-containing protein n=1 Tax=Aristolochia fimbriata TaxID=158543 RepID=A0AAV7E6T0_ARIFI|nr:hypothetical protein H6P81_018912 [Aristolochia fimbriata]
MDTNFDFSSLLEAGGDELDTKFGFDRNCGFAFDQLFPPRLPLPPYQDTDPRVLLNNLVFIEQKVRDLQGVVRSMIPERDCVTRRQMVASEITSIILQVISFAGKVMQAFRSPDVDDDTARQIVLRASGSATLLRPVGTGISDNLPPPLRSEKPRSVGPLRSGDAGKEEEEEEEKKQRVGNMYQVLELEKEEILAPHTHFCTICGKGFKRDANLRMHMRGHGDIYKTPDALANPNKSSKEDLLHFRYSCPFDGCRRNRRHKNFQPLKTILCVRNHYKRSHCDKSFICSRCKSKRFSVMADLKTHEKHCGEDKWQCSCGTTFSRKDKLFGHITLFQGHTPVVHARELIRSCSRVVTDDFNNAGGGVGGSPPPRVSVNGCSVMQDHVLGDRIGDLGQAPSGDLTTRVEFQRVVARIQEEGDCAENHNNDFQSAVVLETITCPRSPGAFLEGQISLHTLLSCECDFDDPNAGNMSPDGL